MSKAGPLTEQIAASIEDVKALLDDNRSLSIAALSRRLKDHEDEVRKRFKGITCPCQAILQAEASLTKLEQRLDLAVVKFRELRKELDQLKTNREKEGHT